MKNYKIVLRSSGPVTQLPDSQKIFGALVTELSRMQGEDAASEVVQSVYNRNIHFALPIVISITQGFTSILKAKS